MTTDRTPVQPIGKVHSGDIDPAMMARVLDELPDAMVITDADGLIQLVNAQAERIFGYAKSEMLGQRVELLIPAHLHGRHEGVRAHFGKDPRLRLMRQGLDLLGRRKDGSEFPAEIALSPLETDGGLLVSAAIRDITDRKRAENEICELNRTLEQRVAERKKEGDLLRQSEERTRAILDNAYDAFVGLNEHGLVTEWNTAAETMFGWRRQEVVGRSLTETIIPAHYREAHRRGMERFMTTGEGRVLNQRIELSAVRKDGAEFPIELSIRAMKLDGAHAFHAFIADITERKKTQEEIKQLNLKLEQRVADRTNELLRSEDRYHNALDSMMEGVSIIGSDWRYVYVNDATTARTVHTREELMGRTLMEVYPGIEETPMFKVLERCMRDRVHETMETEFRFPNGKTGQFAMSIQPATDGLFILSTDITEKKRAELELGAQREQLEQQNKELEQFAFIASHDLQEPLRMVTSYVQLLQRRYGEKLDDDAKEFIGFAVEGTARMKQLIDDLLAYSRLGRPAPLQNVDMNIILEQVRANLTPAIMECGALLTSDQLPCLRASQTEMVQVMQNLIGNAVKFHRNDVIPEVRVTGREEVDHWRFDVHDNGIGIAEQYSEKVFVPFKRLHDKSKYSGSGIGLAVAQKIVQRYGGRIWFSSVPGEGTTFHFTIKRSTS